MITDLEIDQSYSDHHSLLGGIRDDYFGLLYLQKEHEVPFEKSKNQIAFGGHDYGIDGFHFDDKRGNLYLFQFKNSKSYSQFKPSLQRLISDGMKQIFETPNLDSAKNEVLVQLRSCIVENRNLIDQVYARFVFSGNVEQAENSEVLSKLREDLENKKYMIEEFFKPRKVGFVVEFRSSAGKVGSVRQPSHSSHFQITLPNPVSLKGPDGQMMYNSFIKLSELNDIHRSLGSRLFHRNVRFYLGGDSYVNREIERALKRIVIDQLESPELFGFDHNGVTIYADKMEEIDGKYLVTSPYVLNGAQTVTTVESFRSKNQDNPKLKLGESVFRQICVPCKVITNANDKFITRITINNNRQNPVAAWNLHANDDIQLALQDKLRDDVGIYYERQEGAFEQLAKEDFEEGNIKERSRAIRLLQLTRIFLLTDGSLSRLSHLNRVFEESTIYDQVFREIRLKADSRYIVLCFLALRRLNKMSQDIYDKGNNAYGFVWRARDLLLALCFQGILNDSHLEDVAEEYGHSLAVPADYMEYLSKIATTRVRFLMSTLMEEDEYQDNIKEDDLGFLKSDRVFRKCMEFAYEKYKWVHKKLDQ